ncbi:unnamed protein product [Gordionus sp. m RMFG-2023]|uniref:muscle, skeletal receptor tyrosine-protein kinase-like n=1 Tax=Gordionus sp. m RMFG-2023 TaxID=3053472 RepID=UPI0030E1481C
MNSTALIIILWLFKVCCSYLEWETSINPFKNITIVQGGSVYLTCNSSFDAPYIRWIHDGKFLLKQGMNHIVTSTGHLFIRDIKQGHSGEYNCVAVDASHEDISKPITINVQNEVEIIEGPEDRNVSYGHIVTAYCVATGEPPPIIYWVKNGNQVNDKSGKRYSEPKLLVNVTKMLRIVCHAYNELIDGAHKAFKSAVLFPIYFNKDQRLKPTSTKYNNWTSLVTNLTERFLETNFSKNHSKWMNKNRFQPFSIPSINTSSNEYLPPLSFILVWAGLPFFIIFTFLLLGFVCKKCVIDRINPFRCYDKTFLECPKDGKLMGSRDFNQDSLRIFISDLPINETYYNKISPDSFRNYNQELHNCAINSLKSKLAKLSLPHLRRSYNKNDISNKIKNMTFLSSHNTVDLSDHQAKFVPSEGLLNEYPRNNIIYVKNLGQGAFGHVFQARAPNLVKTEPWTMVAVKMIKEGVEINCDLEEDFAREARLMAQFNHPNVIKLLGICSVGKPLCLLLEYMSYGDLNHLLQRYNPYKMHFHQLKANKNCFEGLSNLMYFDQKSARRILRQSKATFLPEIHDFFCNKANQKRFGNFQTLTNNEFYKPSGLDYNSFNPGIVKSSNSDICKLAQSLTLNDLIHIAKQITTGMLYLSSKQFIHRDLATRNCLVGHKFIVKISDFGLCRKIETYASSQFTASRDRALSYSKFVSNYQSSEEGIDYYRTTRLRAIAIPVRWMPPEAILFNKFSIASDVWSMGIVLWEIFAFSIQPYAWLKNKTEIVTYLKRGERLPKPTLMPDSIYKCILTECWRVKPCQRPNFKRIYDLLSRIDIEIRINGH